MSKFSRSYIVPTVNVDPVFERRLEEISSVTCVNKEFVSQLLLWHWSLGGGVRPDINQVTYGIFEMLEEEFDCNEEDDSEEYLAERERVLDENGHVILDVVQRSSEDLDQFFLAMESEGLSTELIEALEVDVSVNDYGDIYIGLSGD